MQDYMMQLGIPSISAELGPRVTAENIATGYFTKEDEQLQRGEEVFAGVQVLVEEADPVSSVKDYTDARLSRVLP